MIAEGIETAEQLNFLEANNCHAGQGYYLFKPMEANAVTNLLKSISNATTLPIINKAVEGTLNAPSISI